MAGDLDVGFMAGPLLALICFALILFGVFTAQIYYYWLTYEEDSSSCDTMSPSYGSLSYAHFLCIQIVYHYLINYFGDIESGLARIELPSHDCPGSLYSVHDQGMYIYRIWHLSKKSFLIAAVPTLFLFARSCFSIASVAFLYHYDTWVNFHAHTAPPATVTSAFTLAVMTDISVASLLVYYLSHMQRLVLSGRTRHIIQTLMVYTINTGAITILFSAGVLATFNLFKMSLLFGGLIEIISKLYANSMLAMLNARQTILNRDRGEGADVFTSVELTRPRVQETRVQIYTETSIQDDMGRRPSGRAESLSAYSKDSPKLDTFNIA
ncbi:hypothetical protein BC629DRAFT_1590329 [Irpex lacteus]|nr:hypothetical protein BC629DRAFT_1590329 [Irpex lacteus]